VKTYTRFIFESYDYQYSSRTITLRYSLDSQIHFSETLIFPEGLALNPDHPDLDKALFALHLSGGASYYKTYCPKEIEVKSGALTPHQAQFWNTLYTYGLGEFFYRNKIDFRGLINFPSTASEHHATAPIETVPPRRALVGFGGGKDSIVTTEILRRTDIEQSLFRVRGHALISKMAEIEELPLVQVERHLPQELFDLNTAGAYNGHIPITAHLSFLSIVTALMLGFDSVFFSNERSSSYGNVEYLGLEINHQWSKSNQFEQSLREYVQEFVTHDVSYLNVLRPLSELAVAGIFKDLPKYFPVATSCNRNWTLSDRDPDAPIWCGTCPKCAFSFALLSAYLPAKTTIGIFGQNLYDNQALLPLYRELWGIEGFKPFECVGTPEEAAAALYLARSQTGYLGTPIMKDFEQTVLPSLKDPLKLVQTLLAPDFKLATPVTKSILEESGAL
jgi:hypothetical protein